MFFNNKVNEYKTMTLGLERIVLFLDKIKIDYNKIKYIHIAGTNGKGSTAKVLSDILEKSGYKTGLYISPHLVKINERIQINSLPVTDLELKKLNKQYYRLSQKYKLTFFEYITALAFIYFVSKKVDVAVLETGLGGRLDATNIVTPLVSIITSIGLDHKEILGGSISEIAFEKAGIIKKETPVVCANVSKLALSVIKKIAKEKKSQIYCSGKDFKTLHLNYNWRKYCQKIEYIGLNKKLKSNFSLLGSSQLYNAGSALCACEILQTKGFNINFDNISSVLSDIKWQARFDVRKIKINNKIFSVIIDGAHNLQAVDNFISLYRQSPFAGRKCKLIFAMMQEKQYSQIIKKLSSYFSKVCLVKVNNERALKQEILYKNFSKYIDNKNITIYNSTESCFDSAENNDTLVVLGSFYLAGEVIKFIKEC